MNMNSIDESIKIPFMDLSAGLVRIYPEIMNKIRTIMEKSQFIGGEEVDNFEKEFAGYCGAKHAVACSNGTDALILILKALGIGRGDVVVTVPNTFIATAEAITAVGARVAFVDVDEKYYTMDPQRLKQYLIERREGNVKAIIPVHLYGQMADMENISEIAREFGVKVIEDAAQAHGAELKCKRPGFFGIAAAFSFFPGKNLGAFGDAGAVVTNDPELAVRIKMLSDHGRTRKYEHEIEGYNCRMDAIQAAILRIKLKHLEEWTDLRIAKADLYDVHLNRKKILRPSRRKDARHVFHLYVIRLKEREKIRKNLLKRGIASGVHYPIPLHLQPAYRYLGYKEGDFPVSEKMSEEILSLPLWPEIDEKRIKYICGNIK